MKKTDKLVTYKEAIKLKTLGYNEECCHYCMIIFENFHHKGRKFNCLCKSYPENWNNKEAFVSIPTYIEAYRWLFYKYTDVLSEKLGFDYIIRPSIIATISLLRMCFRKMLQNVISSTKSTKSK